MNLSQATKVLVASALLASSANAQFNRRVNNNNANNRQQRNQRSGSQGNCGDGDQVLTIFGMDGCNQVDCTAERIDGYPTAVQAGNEFLRRITGPEVKSFEDINVNTANAPIVVSTGAGGDSITVTFTGPDLEMERINNSQSTNGGRFPTGGRQYLETSSNGNLRVRMDVPIAAFGFFGTDIGDEGGLIILRTFLGDEPLNDFVFPEEYFDNFSLDDRDGSALFFGIIDTEEPFDEVLFVTDEPGNRDFFGFDQFTVATEGRISGSARTGTTNQRGVTGNARVRGGNTRAGTRGGEYFRDTTLSDSEDEIRDSQRDARNARDDVVFTDLCDSPFRTVSSSSDRGDTTRQTGGTGGQRFGGAQGPRTENVFRNNNRQRDGGFNRAP